MHALIVGLEPLVGHEVDDAPDRRLVEDGDGTLDTFEGESRAKIPLVGGKIEKLLAEKLVLGWNVEHRAGVAWLRGER